MIVVGVWGKKLKIFLYAASSRLLNSKLVKGLFCSIPVSCMRHQQCFLIGTDSLGSGYKKHITEREAGLKEETDQNKNEKMASTQVSLQYSWIMAECQARRKTDFMTSFKDLITLCYFSTYIIVRIHLIPNRLWKKQNWHE